MGATNSLPNYETKYSETPDKTRLVTIINKTATGNVIEISEAVVNRLRHGAINANNLQKQSKENGVMIGTDNRKENYIIERNMFLTCNEIDMEKERILKENDSYWAQRLQQKEHELNRTNRIMESEYNSEILKVKRVFAATELPYQSQRARNICVAPKSALIECYKTNNNQALKCSAFVNNFAECVVLSQNNILADKY